MDARIQKHRMMRWIGRLLIMLSVVTFPSVALSTIEEVAPIHLQMWDACSNGRIYLASTPQEACKKFVLAMPPVLALTDLGYTATSATSGYCTQLRNQYPDHPQLNYCGARFVTVSITCPPASPAYTLVGTSPNNILMCKRNIPDDLTITLSGGDQIEPSKGSSLNNLPITATVVNESNNQPPSTPIKVRISLKVDPTSGGHEHGDSTRPRGRIENTQCSSDAECWSGMTDTSGKVVFNFKSPEAAGKHTITATCDGCTNNPQFKTVNVKVEGLLPIPNSVFYRPITPNADTNHPKTHFLKPEASAKLIAIARQYYVTTYRRTNGYIPNVMLNDASLEWGGILDCFLTCPNSEEWKPSHKEHRKGSVIDIRARIPPADTSMPNTLLFEEAFILAAEDNDVDPGAVHGSGNGRHFHLKLLGIGE